jgi:2-dehydro-3-deoxygluconokinase
MVEFWADEPLGSAERLHRAYGGDVLNALVTAARLGSRVGFMTKVGDDPFGPGLLEAWRAEGVDTAHAPLVEGENGVYFISLLADGEREFTYRRTGSAASTLAPDDLGASYLASSRTLLVSGITQAISLGAGAATLTPPGLPKGAASGSRTTPTTAPDCGTRRGGWRRLQLVAK